MARLPGTARAVGVAFVVGACLSAFAAAVPEPAVAAPALPDAAVPKQPLPQPPVPEALWVDPAKGDDRNPGTQQKPLKSISAAIALLPDPLEQSVTIHLAAGTYTTTGGKTMAATRLELMRRMRPGVTVRLIGAGDATGGASGGAAGTAGKNAGRSPDSAGGDYATILGWESDTALIDAREGDWWLENVRIGTFTTRQRRGVEVAGPAHVTLRNVTFRQRSLSDAGIYAHRGGQVSLLGRVALNEHLHAAAGKEHLHGGQPEDERPAAEPETFCGIIATDHGLVRFREREGASLELGNGSLSASYYGVIRLGCETARITSWNEQSNNLAINNGGRIDLHNTTVTLDARQRRNTPVGLEHDGHVLAEGARLIIVSDNDSAIALQKASTLACNDVELRGKYEYALWASSGSMFVGGFRGDVGRIDATTGATINIEKVTGRLIGPVTARHAARISLPDRDVVPE
ncbi:MAG: DUF1565 domain-containing protein [Planctomycetota bacterium]